MLITFAGSNPSGATSRLLNIRQKKIRRYYEE